MIILFTTIICISVVAQTNNSWNRLKVFSCNWNLILWTVFWTEPEVILGCNIELAFLSHPVFFKNAVLNTCQNDIHLPPCLFSLITHVCPSLFQCKSPNIWKISGWISLAFGCNVLFFRNAFEMIWIHLKICHDGCLLSEHSDKKTRKPESGFMFLSSRMTPEMLGERGVTY